MDCPELRELAAYLETGRADAVVLEHIGGCDACRDALEELEDEVMSLQISISELWFREHVSCPHKDVLQDYLDGSLDPGAREYVTFHIDDLECAYCQGRVVELEASRTREGKRRLEKSRSRIGKATSMLIRDLKKRN